MALLLTLLLQVQPVLLLLLQGLLAGHKLGQLHTTTNAAAAVADAADAAVPAWAQPRPWGCNQGTCKVLVVGVLVLQLLVVLVLVLLVLLWGSC